MVHISHLNDGHVMDVYLAYISGIWNEQGHFFKLEFHWFCGLVSRQITGGFFAIASRFTVVHYLFC